MTDTPLKNAYRKDFKCWWPTDDNDKAVWMASARATLAQIKPFFDQYQFLRDKTEHGSLEEMAASIRLDEVYDDVVAPLLKELEE